MINGDDRDIRNYLSWMREAIDISDELQGIRIECIVEK